jgi:HupE / UreJ protein
MHGIEHILLGYDHLLFVLALILIVRRGQVLLITVTAFTIAHSITLFPRYRLGDVARIIRESQHRREFHRRIVLRADGDLSLADAFGNRLDLRVIDTVRNVIENNTHGRAILDGLKTILREHSNERDFVLDNERHRGARLQRPIADGQCDNGDIAVGRRTNCRLR